MEAQGAFAKGLVSNVFNTLDDPDLGYVGSIQSVNIDLVNDVLESDYIPVIAPMGIQNGEMLNINANCHC